MTVSLDLAITAIRANRRDEGRKLLNLLIQQNPNDEAAWLWMSEVVENNEQRVRCLQNVLTINPNNSIAKRGLDRLGIPTKILAKGDTKPVTPKSTQTEITNNSAIATPNKAVTVAMPIQQELGADQAKQLSPNVERPLPSREEMVQPVTVEKETKEIPAIAEETGLLGNQPTSSADEIGETGSDIATEFSHKTNTPDSQETALLDETSTKRPRNRELSDTKTKLRKLTAALAIKQAQRKQAEATASQTESPVNTTEGTPSSTSSQPTPPILPTIPMQPFVAGQTPAVPLPDFDNAMNLMSHTSASQPVPIIATMPNGHSQPVPAVRPNSVPIPIQMPGYISPSQPTRPIQLTNGALHPSQIASNPMIVQLTQSQYQQHPPQATTMGMPIYNTPPSEPIPVVHANTTLGAMPISPSLGPHSSPTMSMPLPQTNGNGAFPSTSMPAQPTPQNHRPLSDQELIAAWQNNNSTYADYDEEDDDEAVNMVAISIFSFLTITALGGFGVLTLLIATGY